MTCIFAKLVSAAHANHFIKSHWIHLCVFLCSLFESCVLKNLKIMRKSPITKYSVLIPGTRIRTYDTIPQHHPRSLHTKLERPINCKTRFIIVTRRKLVNSGQRLILSTCELLMKKKDHTMRLGQLPCRHIASSRRQVASNIAGALSSSSRYPIREHVNVNIIRQLPC